MNLNQQSWQVPELGLHYKQRTPAYLLREDDHDTPGWPLSEAEYHVAKIKLLQTKQPREEHFPDMEKSHLEH